EWYFLPFYAILRAIPWKLGGVIAMMAATFILFALPWLDSSKVKSGRFRPVYKQFFWIFVIDCFVLGYIGSQPATDLFVMIGRIATAYYFIHFLVIIPLIGKFEKPLPLPKSIAAAVLKQGKVAAAGKK
ncbi:MAG: cytochrome b, partial [Rhodospirillales bacterium]